VAGLFNVALLESSKGSTLAYLQTLSACTTAPATPQGCFSTLLTSDVPFGVILPIIVLGILFGTLYGMYFEYLPGRGYPMRALGIGTLLLLFLVLLGATGNYSATDKTQLAILRAFDTVAMLGYIVILARFYRRITREVNFESARPSKLKIWVDGKNYTDKMKTLGVHSTHKIAAPDAAGEFHQWLVSGGISVTDPKNPETRMRVEGDGLLKIS
jgi:hypothetical protein